MKATLYGLTKNKNDIHVKSQLEKMLAQVGTEGAAVIDGANIAAESIYGKSIVAGSIEATQIKAGAITSDHITTNGIVADKIKTGILRSTNGTSWLNLNDGTFSYANGNFTFQGGKMVVRAHTIELGGQEVPTKTQTEEYADSLGETLQGQIDTSIKSTEVEYYSSTSSTSPVGGVWSTTAPEWKEGRFMWSRTKITPNKGNVIYKPNQTGTNISGATGNSAKIVTVTPSAQLFWRNEENAVTPATITVDGSVQNTTISAWQYSVNGGSFSTTLPTGVTRSGNKVSLTGKTVTARTIAVKALDASGNTDTTTIAMVQDGAKGSTGGTGAKGDNSIVGYLTNESVTLGASSTGAVDASSFTTASGTFRVFDGITEVTTNSACVFSLSASTGVTLTINSAGLYTVTKMSADTATAEFKAVYKGITIIKSLSLSKSRVGATGGQGPKGADGKGISSAVVTYQNHTNGTTAPTGTWSNSPSPVKGQYLWTRTVTTYTEGNPITTYAVAYNALDGQVGATGGKGNDGTGISSTVIRYFQSTSGINPPSGDGAKTPPTPIQGQYNWTRTVITYTNGTNSTAWSTSYNAKDGLKGDKGATGSQGPQGIQGPTGANGTSQYIHIRYSTASNGNPMTDKPSASTVYIGIANTTSSTAPTGYASYTWSLYKGEKGDQGIQGPSGANGQPTYTWIKYADTDAGVGMSDSPIGKKYIGMAFNKTTQTESTTASQYTWSLMPQNIEIGGRNLVRSYNDFRSGGPAPGITPTIEGGLLKVVTTSGNGNYHSGWQSSKFVGAHLEDHLKDGDDFTVTFRVKRTAGTGKPTIYFKPGMGYYSLAGELGSEWTNLTYSGKWVKSRGISLHLGWSGTAGTFFISEWQIEKGTVGTDITEAPEDVELAQNKKVYNPVRYIRDWLKGSSANIGNHWFEIMANDTNGTNVAKGKTVTTNGAASNLGVITDGLVTGTYSHTGSGKHYVEIDLRNVYHNIASVSVWHYHTDSRTYYETRTEVSEDRINWYPVFDSLTEGTYAETASGKTYPNTRARAEALISAYNMSQQLAISTSKVVINGGNITAGTVKSANSDSWINLDNGQFSFGKGNMVWNGSNLTVKGNIDAASINTGTLATSRIPNLSADKITVGSIKDKNSRNTINLDNGTFTLANGNIVYNGSTLEIKTGVSFSALDSAAQTKINNGEAAKTKLDSKESTWDAKLTDAQVAAKILSDKKIKDTRKTNQNPAWYFSNYPNQIVREFKEVSVMGVGTGVYGILTTDVPWNDSSGGSVKQTFRTKTEEFKRDGTTTSWSSWVNHDAMAVGAKTLTDKWAFTGKTTINGGQVEADTITAAQIAANTITATQIASRTITTDRIVANAITANEIAAGTITATEIKSRAITTDRIAANAITANEINVANLSALSANLGNVTAGTIKSTNGLIDINLNTGVVNLGQRLTINAKPVATKEDVDSISVGGRNLYRNSGIKVTSSGYNIAGYNFAIKPIAGEKYTLSIKGKINSQHHTGFYTNIFDGTAHPAMATVGPGDLGSDGVYRKTFTMPHLADYISTILYSYPLGTYVEASVEWIKLEKGNIATDWTEAPEDVQEQIGSKADIEVIDNLKNDLNDYTKQEDYLNSIGEVNSSLESYKSLLEIIERDLKGERDENGEFVLDADGNPVNMGAIKEIEDIVNREAAIVNNLGELSERWNFIGTNIIMASGGLLIGETGLDKDGKEIVITGIRIGKNSVDFVENTIIVAQITGTRMKINRAIFVESITIGEHKIETMSGGHTTWTWVPAT